MKENFQNQLPLSGYFEMSGVTGRPPTGPCHQVYIRFTHNGQCCSTHTTLSIIVSICITRATLSYLDIATYSKFCSWIRVIKLTTHDCWLRPIWNNVLIKMMEVLSCFLDFYVYTEEDCRAECLHVQLCNVNREFYFGHEPSWWSEDRET